MNPSSNITDHFRLTPDQKAALRRLGLLTIRDLLYHFPVRFETAGASGNAAGLVPGVKVTLIGTFHGLKARKLWKSRRNATEGWFEDGTGRVKVMWFNQPYIASYIPENTVAKVTATVGGKDGRVYLTNPEVEIIPPDMAVAVANAGKGLFSDGTAGADASKLFPVYPESRGITSRWFYHAIERVFAARAHTAIPDPIPSDILKKYRLPDLGVAFAYIHTPEKDAHAKAARKRFAFEEILTIQITRALERAENDSFKTFPITDARMRTDEFLGSIPFPPTKAQIRAIDDVIKDFGKPHSMARLLEGDVGSGKTLVAAATSYAAVTARPPDRESGTLQVAYMAPTEILATQHFQSFIEYFSHLPINIGLITGSGCKKFPSKIGKGKATDVSRAQLLKWVEGGEIALLIGTHALIQKSVQFQHLAYVIIDEQHRFATKQRRALARKGGGGARDSDFLSEDCLSPVLRASSAGQKIGVPRAAEYQQFTPTPHFLSMTATPIPRTLALTIYGDLDLSILDELPPGRAKITTRIVKKTDRAQAYESVRAELAKGRQAYVVCPRIEEPDPEKINALQAKSAKAEAKRLQKDVFPEYEVGLLHGAMKPKEKDDVMKQFERNEIQILVATSVVEVGINVPNATAIMIEGAERFGLAQLHQLRGRVMRSAHPPLCFLLPETTGEVSVKRLKALEKSDDGFTLAESDLAARGAGDLRGGHQWGISDIGMEALQNVKLIRAAREEAIRIVQADPGLAHHDALKTRARSVHAELHAE